MDNYKGLYYKETKEQRFYEGGAHFPYEELYKILLYLKEELKEQNKNKNIQINKNPANNEEDSNIYTYDLVQNHNNNNKENKLKTRTRNVMNTYLYNNPNTLIKKNIVKKKDQQINIGLSFNERRESSKSRMKSTLS